MVKKLDYAEYNKRILSYVKDTNNDTNNDNFSFDLSNMSNFYNKMRYKSPSDLYNEYNRKKSMFSKCTYLSVEKFIT